MKAFLDVDGVLNHCGPTKQFATSRFECKVERANHVIAAWGTTVYTSPTVGQYFTDMGLEIVFLTAWGSHAPVYIAPLMGWDSVVHACEPHWDRVEPARRHSPLLPGHEHCEMKSWWKAHWMEHFAPRDEPFVWIDDHLEPSDWAWAERHGLDALLIKPRTQGGLTHAHLAQIDDFVCSRTVGNASAA